VLRKYFGEMLGYSRVRLTSGSQFTGRVNNHGSSNPHGYRLSDHRGCTDQISATVCLRKLHTTAMIPSAHRYSGVRERSASCRRRIARTHTVKLALKSLDHGRAPNRFNSGIYCCRVSHLSCMCLSCARGSRTAMGFGFVLQKWRRTQSILLRIM